MLYLRVKEGVTGERGREKGREGGRKEGKRRNVINEATMLQRSLFLYEVRIWRKTRPKGRI